MPAWPLLLLMLATLGAVEHPPAATSPAPAAALLVVDGMIDGQSARYFRRACISRCSS